MQLIGYSHKLNYDISLDFYATNFGFGFETTIPENHAIYK